MIILPLLTIAWLVFITIEWDDESLIENHTPISELQTVVQSEALLHESIRNNWNIDMRRWVYDFAWVFDKKSENYEQFLYNFLTSNFTDPSVEDFHILYDLNQKLSYGEISEEDFIDMVYLSFWIRIWDDTIEQFKSFWVLLHDEKNIHKERLRQYKDNLQLEYDTTFESLIQNIIESIKEQWESISQEEILKINEMLLSYFTSDDYTFSPENLYDILRDLWETYNIEINTHEIINSYIELEKINIIISEVHNKLKYQEGEILSWEYKNLIEATTIKLDDLTELHSIMMRIESEELISFLSRELDYSDIILLSQERIVEQWELWSIARSYFDMNDFLDDSEIIRDMSAIAYIKKLEWFVAVENLMWSPLIWDTNMLLYSWYSIETSTNSRAVIVFDDDSILRLWENSSVTLEWEADTSSWMRINYWETWVRVLRPFLSWNRFNIEWNGVSLWVRGTSLYINSDEVSSDIYVVDSATEQWDNKSVIFAYEWQNELQELWSWRRVQVNHISEQIQTSSVTRTSLLITHSDIGRFIRDDLYYMSVLVDDKRRWFMNTALETSQLWEDIVTKIKEELRVTIPTQNEKSRVFSNAELFNHPISNEITTQNIYELTLKDILIDHVKEIWDERESEIIQEILEIDVDEIIDIRWGRRYIERRIQEGVIQEVIEENTSVKDTLLKNRDDDLQDVRRRLNQVFNTLTLPWRSQRLTQNIILPTSVNEDSDIVINWKIPHQINNEWDMWPYFITQDPASWGLILQINQEINWNDIYGNIQADIKLSGQKRIKNFPFIIPSRDHTDKEKLEMSAEKLLQHLDAIWILSNRISIPDFNSYDLIIPNIKWRDTNTPSRIDADWNIQRPEFSVWDIHDYTVWVELSYRNEKIDIPSITLATIKTLPEAPETVETARVFTSTRYWDCDTQDIVLPNGQVWSMCNVWTGISWVTEESYGLYYWFSWASQACANWYRTPNRSDWRSALDQFQNFREMQTHMQLPNTGWYIGKQKWFLFVPYIDMNWKHVWRHTYYWTRDQRSWYCTNKCWYAIRNWQIRDMRVNYDMLPVRCIRNEDHVFSEPEEEFLEMQM